MSVIFLRILLSIKVLQEVTVEIFIPEILSSVSIAAISMRIKFLLEKREQVLPLLTGKQIKEEMNVLKEMQNL